MRSTRLIIATFILLGLHASGHPQNRRQDQELPEELYQLAQKKADVINRSISESQSEWAGTYAAGDHHPTILFLDPTAGFLVTSSLHTFAPSWINYGTVSLDGRSLKLRPELAKDNKYAHEIENEFRLVRWDKQRFLVPPDELLDFAYAVHSRSSSQLSFFFSQAGNGQVTRRSLPDLPAEYVRYMRMAPIIARITRVIENNGYGQTVELSAGKRQKIIPGMYLYHSSRSGFEFSVRVIEVQESTAVAQTASTVQRGDGQIDSRIKVGWKVSSRMPVGFMEPG